MSKKQQNTRPQSNQPPVVTWLLTPFQEFIKQEASSGIVLLVATLLALLWANSPVGDAYTSLWGTKLMIGAGSWVLSLSALHWINDGLMAIFFFVVGLEIKREILVGELASRRRATLPVVAAIGGMVAPALLYWIFNARGADAAGWGVPMATDIAFAVGIMALLGRHAPLPLRIFLTALAIVDDIGAVLVIALFYSHGLVISHLLVAIACLLALILVNWLDLRHPWLYILLGVGLWLALLESGLHATIAGVLLAMTIPAKQRIDTQAFAAQTRTVLAELERAVAKDENSDEVRQTALQSLERACEAAESPLQRFEHALHPWVSFAIMPLFALANAGVILDSNVATIFAQPVSWGVISGLVIGKQLGITLAVWLSVKTRLAELPKGIAWRQIYGAGWLAGIGFTMSLFIADLAFGASPSLAVAKFSILAASLVAGLGGWLILRNSS